MTPLLRFLLQKLGFLTCAKSCSLHFGSLNAEDVLVDALTLNVRVWVSATGDAGDGINGFICLKPQIQFLLLRSHHLIL